MPNERHFLPTVIVFWMALFFIYLFGLNHSHFGIHSGYILFFGQVIFDALALFAFIKLANRANDETKFISSCFTLAVLGLLLSDFFYHATHTVHWFSIPGSEFYDMPLIGFFVFLVLGLFRMNSLHKDEQNPDRIFGLGILFTAVMAIIVAFFPGSNMMMTFKDVDTVLSITLMIVQILAVISALIIMPKVNRIPFNYFCVGVFTIFFADFMFNWRGVDMSDSDLKGILELVWLLGSMLIASGAWLKLTRE